MSSFGNIMIVLDELNPAIQVNPLGEWQNLDLRVYEVEISAEKQFFSSPVGNREILWA